MRETGQILFRQKKKKKKRDSQKYLKSTKSIKSLKFINVHYFWKTASSLDISIYEAFYSRRI